MRWGIVAATVFAAAVGVAVLAVLNGLHRKPPPPRRVVAVTVVGRSEALRVGTTLADVVRRFHLQPPAGDLLDVHGAVLRRGVDPGTIRVNGVAVASTKRLRTGDRITLVRGRDRREPLRTQVLAIPGGLPPNPQRTLGRIPSVAVVVRGAISHELVHTRTRAVGEQSTSGPVVALTFDDGPSPVYTPRILAVLERLHVPATFFAIGYLAAAYPDIIRAELAAGMDVGNHTYNHPEVPPFNQLPARLRNDELELSRDDLQAAGASPALFRPPAGSNSPAVVASAERLSERVVLWSIDPGDWKPGMTSAAIARAVLGAVRPGSIVLLHDGGGNRRATVAALPAIVNGLRRRGLRLVTTDGF
jgi:peptidoglycan/xylan/chitin deacetylase (PgdA/CDA1 family)/sulfur carrier protein ThiS